MGNLRCGLSPQGTWKVRLKDKGFFSDSCVIPLAQFQTQDDTSHSTFKAFISVPKRLAKSSREVDQ